jgi:hypothetical protein
MKYIYKIIIFIAVTIFLGGLIIYSAISYNGALSWKLDEWKGQKEVKLEHNNFFTDGVNGILGDLNNELDLPDELYISNKFQMTFDENGTIKTIYTLLYGRDKSGETKTYLIDYDADKSENMSVVINGEANANYNEDMRFAPMLRILEKADCTQKVKEWSQAGYSDIYEILYFGRRSFKTSEGLIYLSGDADGDGIETGENDIYKLSSGGEIVGFEVSLHIPDSENVVPVRYIMEPEYISQDNLNNEREEQQADEAKNTKSWTVDRADGTMYFFLDELIGWRLIVADAAAGSRFYEMEKTENGGSTWNIVNDDPFEGKIGVAEGLVFFDDNFGFVGLTGASQSYSQLYVTENGGITFEKLQLPLDTDLQLPESAVKYGFTVEDYDYFCMPEEEKGVLTIKAVTESGENEGIVFQSQDNGKTWVYTGAFSK